MFIDYYAGFRLCYLKHIDFSICFPYPEYEYTDYGCHKSREELRQRDEIFTEQIRWMFSGLHSPQQAIQVGSLD
jgi:hypothetical protein